MTDYMSKRGDWSEAPTRLCRETDEPVAQAFQEQGVRTVLEAPASIAARAYASVVAPERGASRPQLPLAPALRQVLSGAPAPSAPRVPTPPARASLPYLTTRRPTPGRLAPLEPERPRRLTLTALPDSNPASIPVLPLAPISRLEPLAPARAGRPAAGRQRFVGVLAVAGIVLCIAALARVIL